MKVVILVNIWGFLKKILHDPVWSKVIGGLILAGLLAFGTLMHFKWEWPAQKLVSKQEDSIKPDIYVNDKIISEEELPKWQNVPLLDKTIYIKYEYYSFIFGGKNLKKIRIAARKGNGEIIRAHINRDKNEIIYNIDDKPYIEFEYKGSAYSIEVRGGSNWSDPYKYILTLKAYLTMDLETIP